MRLPVVRLLFFALLQASLFTRITAHAAEIAANAEEPSPAARSMAAAGAQGHAPTISAAPVWLPVDSDLPPDPALHDATLPNGVRYRVLPNQEPKHHVSLRLVVAVGSLYEHDDERGLAHFVEHMAFRGTRDFPDGRMGQTLQHLGIAFGPDSTAFTSYNYTIYHLEVPTTDPSALGVAVHALREYAAGVTFQPEAIERERGVVLAEMATRDTPGARAADYDLRLLWPASRETRRKVIGEADQIRSFQPSDFNAFYDAWYRPERMAIIAVGDLEPKAFDALIRREFGPLRPRAAARSVPTDLICTQAARPTVGIFRDPDAMGLSLTLEHVRSAPRVRDSHAERVRRLHQSLACTMFQLRLRKVAERPDAPFVGAIAGVSAGLRDWEVASVEVNGRIDDWRQIAIELERQQRTALQYGFTTAEMNEVRGAYATQFEEATRSAGTRPSPLLAQQLFGSLMDGTVFTTPAALQRDLAADLAAATPAECLAAFRAAWLPGGFTALVAANTIFTGTAEDVAGVLNQSRADAVQRPADVPIPDFAYDHFGAPGQLTKDLRLSDLDVRLAQFGNRVCFNFKRTQFEADAVTVCVRVGTGLQSQLKSRPGLYLFADAAFTAGGVGRHTRQELGDILAGHAVQLSFSVASDSLLFSVHCAPRDLELALRVVTAYITDPAYRPESVRIARAEFGSILGQLAASPGGPITAGAVRDLFGDDGRFGMPTYDEFLARDLGEMQAWLDPQLAHGSIEVSVVGDIPWEQARRCVAETFGALPQRQPVAESEADVPAVFSAPRTTWVAYPISATVPQVAVGWYWPVPRNVDVHTERRCYLLAALVAERLRLRLREELGATYGSSVSFNRLDGFPASNYFSFYAEIDPARLDQVQLMVIREMRAIVRNGFTADEFARSREPYVRAMNDDVRTNGYWAETVLSDAQKRPARVAAARDRAADLQTLTRADVERLAQEFLSPERAFKYVTVPAPPKPPRG